MEGAPAVRPVARENQNKIAALRLAMTNASVDPPHSLVNDDIIVFSVKINVPWSAYNGELP